MDPTELVSALEAGGSGLGAIFVAVAYRLSAFGFLAGQPLVEEAGGMGAGNYGMWDQVSFNCSKITRSRSLISSVSSEPLSSGSTALSRNSEETLGGSLSVVGRQERILPMPRVSSYLMLCRSPTHY